LGTAADASLVYALLHVNLSAMSKLGGVSSPRFWLALTAGVAAAFVTESALLLSGI
jgi:ZIP family zinc transporter